MIRVLADVEAMTRAAAEAFCEAEAEARSARGRFAVALAGGSTPRRLYELLAAEPYRSRVAWNHVEFFWGDERAVPPDHPESNYRMVNDAMLRKLAIPGPQIHRIAAERENLDAVACDYEAEIARSFGVPPGGAPPALDLALLGMGVDGHTVSLFPSSEALREHRRWVVACRGPRPLVDRVTLTLPILNAARYVLFLVAGEEKAQALANVLEGPADLHGFPAQGIRPVSGRLLWLVDRTAAERLSFSTPERWLADNLRKFIAE